MTRRSIRRTPARKQTLRDLHELVAALDRRVPQVLRCGEGSIARAAAALRAEAVTPIADLERNVMAPRARD